MPRNVRSSLCAVHVSHGCMIRLLPHQAGVPQLHALHGVGGGFLGRKNQMLKRKWASEAAAEMLRGLLKLIEVIKICLPASSDLFQGCVTGLPLSVRRWWLMWGAPAPTCHASSFDRGPYRHRCFYSSRGSQRMVLVKFLILPDVWSCL